jgi:serine/threonine-protein kinase Chk2
MARERTLLSSINDVKITHVIEIESDKDPVKIYIKNPNGKSNQNKVNKSVDTNSNGIPKSRPGAPKQEETPSQNRDPTEFMGLGGKGDQELFGNEGSIYSKNELTETTKG